MDKNGLMDVLGTVTGLWPDTGAAIHRCRDAMTIQLPEIDAKWGEMGRNGAKWVKLSEHLAADIAI